MSFDKTKPVERKDFLALAYYEVWKKLNPFTGSRGNMHYRLQKEYYVRDEDMDTESPVLDDEGKPVPPPTHPRFRLWYWPGPYTFDKTADILKQEATFEFSEEGLQEIADFLNEQYESKPELWHIDTMR